MRQNNFRSGNKQKRNKPYKNRKEKDIKNIFFDCDNANVHRKKDFIKLNYSYYNSKDNFIKKNNNYKRNVSAHKKNIHNSFNSKISSQSCDIKKSKQNKTNMTKCPKHSISNTGKYPIIRPNSSTQINKKFILSKNPQINPNYFSNNPNSFSNNHNSFSNNPNYFSNNPNYFSNNHNSFSNNNYKKNNNNNMNNLFNLNNNRFLNNNNYNQLYKINAKTSFNNKIRPKSSDFFNTHNNINDLNIGSLRSIGLNNIGATCYMNATLQCLANVKNLTTYLLKNSTKISTNPYKYKLTNAYTEVLINIWNTNYKSYSPNNFKRVISEMNSLFDGIKANDSKDLIIFLLETLHKELNTVKVSNNLNPYYINQYNYQSSFKDFINFFTNNYKSIISDIFYGMFNSMMTCFNCNSTVNNIQCFNLLIFPLNEVRLFKNRIQNYVNIIECFEYYQKNDIMSGDNQIHCNKCSSMSNSINMTKLIISPNVLVINLNRGKGLQFDIKFIFEEYLDISNFVYYNNRCPTKYELIGIVTHFGPSSMDGHFIAFCKSFKNNKWYKYNDALVDPSNFREAQSTGVPYILFYSSERLQNPF